MHWCKANHEIRSKIPVQYFLKKGPSEECTPRGEIPSTGLLFNVYAWMTPWGYDVNMNEHFFLLHMLIIILMTSIHGCKQLLMHN